MPVTLRPGDQVRAFPKTAASRTVALCVTTNRGVSRIFTGTAASGTAQLTDLQDSSNSIGDTLQGQTLTQAILTVGVALLLSRTWVLKHMQRQKVYSLQSNNLFRMHGIGLSVLELTPMDQ